jgi:hypothetical protein
MTGTMLRAAVQEAIRNIQNDAEVGNGFDIDRLRDVATYALEVFDNDARKVRPCVYVVLNSIGGFTKEEKAATWDAVATKFVGKKVYKANPMAKLDAMLAEVSK